VPTGSGAESVGTTGGTDPVVLAVDGGNTKTDAVLLAADGGVVGRARGGPSNHQMRGLEGAISAIDETVRAAMTAAHLPPDRRPVCAVGVYCLAGVDLPIDEERLTDAVHRAGWATTDVVANDIFAVVRAGATAGWGVGVVCGTGLNCAAAAPDGSAVRFPSLGELSGDFAQGGAWLGIRGLGLALRARDGRGEPTALAERVPAHFGRTTPEDVLTAVYTGEIGFDRLYELARVVLEAAGDGDAASRGAADLLADEVVAMATAAIRRLDLVSLPVEVVLGGGIFHGREAGFVERVGTGIRAAAPAAVLRFLEVPPVVGAGLLGLDRYGRTGAGWTAGSAEHRRAEATLRAAFAGTDRPTGP
jgi:N-acetylglucosamine kinase-like BadF-type ATPase